ncbi:MAG: cupin domain-containing protein [Proteobacteria bacterium]|nr:cupin domain-containing protein [Pseudomonadota bacterium]MBU1449638.1 cupin domain-containing protein [Pseudomonadota bacterium]MBU2469947.1 cupin domain-containing protein [Pseudomonadota bacterium]MBU2516945.1 cupin domain-containing protein [Pseudomonadota bacterium]
MRNVFDISDLKDIPAFSPPHHTGTVDRKLVHDGAGAEHMAIWHGEIEPGGTAEEHVHQDMEQAFYVLGGEGLFTLEQQAHRLAKGGLIFVPPKVPHSIVSTGEVSLQMLIIMSPPPAGANVWQE